MSQRAFIWCSMYRENTCMTGSGAMSGPGNYPGCNPIYHWVMCETGWSLRGQRSPRSWARLITGMEREVTRAWDIKLPAHPLSKRKERETVLWDRHNKPFSSNCSLNWKCGLDTCGFCFSLAPSRGQFFTLWLSAAQYIHNTCAICHCCSLADRQEYSSCIGSGAGSSKDGPAVCERSSKLPS